VKVEEAPEPRAAAVAMSADRSVKQSLTPPFGFWMRNWKFPPAESLVTTTVEARTVAGTVVSS